LLLGFLAMGICILSLAYVGMPEVLATASEGVVSDTPRELSASSGTVTGMAPATYPLRWYVSLVHHEVASSSVDCKTTIVVVNLHTSNVQVELETYDLAGSVQATASTSIGAGGSYYVNTAGTAGSFDTGGYPTTGDHLITGHGRVYANHPNILAFNYVECPTGAVSVTSYPVGATLELFQAGYMSPGSMPIHADIAKPPRP
jgi:hypothetical protein